MFLRLIVLSCVLMFSNSYAEDNSIDKLSDAQAKELEEINKCYTIARSVCGQNETIDKCLMTKRNAFTSFCVDELTRNNDEVKELVESASMEKCTQGLDTVCKLEVPDEQVKPDMAVLRAAVAKYQQCMTQKAEASSSCNLAKDNLANKIMDKYDTKNKNKNKKKSN